MKEYYESMNQWFDIIDIRVKNSAFYNVLAIYQDKVFKGSIYGVPIKIDTRVGY